MIHIFKILFYIRFQDKSPLGVIMSYFPREVCKTLYCLQCAFAFPVGVRIKDKTSFEELFNNVTERMMYYPISESRPANFPRFRITKNERLQWFGPIGMKQQITAQLQKIVLKIVLKFKDVVACCFSFPRFLIGKFEVGVGAKFIPQISRRSFHRKNLGQLLDYSTHAVMIVNIAIIGIEVGNVIEIVKPRRPPVL